MASGSKVLPNYREVFSVLEGLGSIATSPEEVEKLLGSAIASHELGGRM